MDLREFLEFKMSTIEGDVTTSIVETWVQRYKDIENTKATVFTDISNFNEWKEERNSYEPINANDIKPLGAQQSEEGKQFDLALKQQNEFLKGETLGVGEFSSILEGVKIGDGLRVKSNKYNEFKIEAITKQDDQFYIWFYNSNENKDYVNLVNVHEIIKK